MKPLGTADLPPGRDGAGPAAALADASVPVWTSGAGRPQQRRMTLAVMASLTLHALLLSLTLGGAWNGVPGLSWPWQERRAEVSRLSIFLVPAPTTPAEVAADATAAPTGTASPAAPSSVFPETTRPMPADWPAEASPTPGAALSARVLPSEPAPPAADETGTEPSELLRAAVSERLAITRQETVARRAAEPSAAAEAERQRAEQLQAAQDRERQAALAAAENAVREAAIAQAAAEAAERETERQAVLQREAERLAVARLESIRLEAEASALARQRAEEQAETNRLEAIRLAEARAEAVRQAEAERIEAQRHAQARAEAARTEALRVAAAQAEAARQQALQQAAEREAARHAAQAEAERIEAQRQAQARAEAARAEALRVAAAQAEAARQQAADQQAASRAAADREYEARREALLRRIGQQLNDEAAQREAQSRAERQDPTISTRRRGRLFGRADPNQELVRYAEAMARKIEQNMTIDAVRDLLRQPHANPVVTVAVRSDGAVETITFVRSSGLPALDAAVTRIIQGQANYPPFPPELVREYDVIEIRRTWYFDVAVRLY